MTNRELPQLGTPEFNDLASAYFGGKPKQKCCKDISDFELGTTCPKCNKSFISIINEPKQETLEEYDAESYLAGIKSDLAQDYWCKKQERMYSEEEVYDILIHHTVELFKRKPITLEDFWNKFKKK